MLLKLMTSAALAAVTLGSASSSPPLEVFKANDYDRNKKRAADKIGNRRGLWTIKYNNGGLRNAIPSNSHCSPTQKRMIMASVLKADVKVRNAYLRWDKNQRSFRKWFGKGNAFDNETVKMRYKYAMEFMQNMSGKNYDILCCKRRMGACRHCRRNTLAYVMSGRRGTTKYVQAHVRICPLSFTRRDRATKLGYTMFHETMHLTSNAGDKGYTRRSCIRTAKSNPTRARYNAQAYLFYALENGGGPPLKKTPGGSGSCNAACRRRRREAKAKIAREAERKRKEILRREKERLRKLRERRERERRERERRGASCWIKMDRAGCKNHLSQKGARSNGLNWFKDSRTGPMARTKRSCAAKALIYIRWCKVKAFTCFGKKGSSCNKKPVKPKCHTDSTNKRLYRCTQTLVKCCAGYEMAWRSNRNQASCHKTSWLNKRSAFARKFTKCSAKPAPKKPTCSTVFKDRKFYPCSAAIPRPGNNFKCCKGYSLMVRGRSRGAKCRPDSWAKKGRYTKCSGKKPIKPVVPTCSNGYRVKTKYSCSDKKVKCCKGLFLIYNVAAGRKSASCLPNSWVNRSGKFRHCSAKPTKPKVPACRRGGTYSCQDVKKVKCCKGFSLLHQSGSNHKAACLPTVWLRNINKSGSIYKWYSCSPKKVTPPVNKKNIAHIIKTANAAVSSLQKVIAKLQLTQRKSL